MQGINQQLAVQLGSSFMEHDALRKTVVRSAQDATNEDDARPSFMRVLAAETLLE